MSYEKLDTPDPKWLIPLFIILILGLIVWGVSASVKYVEEEGEEGVILIDPWIEEGEYDYKCTRVKIIEDGKLLPQEKWTEWDDYSDEVIVK